MKPGFSHQPRGFAHCFLTDLENRQYALSFLDILQWQATANIDASSSSNPVPAPIIQASFNYFDQRKAAHNIFQRFKKGERFTGDPGEKVLGSLANHEEGEVYRFNEAQKLRYLHILFDGELEQFFQAYVQNTSNRDQIAAQKMILEFNTITFQKLARQYLQELKLQSKGKKRNVMSMMYSRKSRILYQGTELRDQAPTKRKKQKWSIFTIPLSDCHGLRLHSRNATKIAPLGVFRNYLLH